MTSSSLIIAQSRPVTSYLISRVLSFIKAAKHDMIGDHDLFQQFYNFMFYAYFMHMHMMSMHLDKPAMQNLEQETSISAGRHLNVT